MRATRSGNAHGNVDLGEVMGHGGANAASTDDGIGHELLFEVNGWSGREGGDVLQGLPDGGILDVGTHGEAFGAYHGGICHAQERQ